MCGGGLHLNSVLAALAVAGEQPVFRGNELKAESKTGDDLLAMQKSYRAGVFLVSGLRFRCEACLLQLLWAKDRYQRE